MRFSREIFERFKWASRASIHPRSNGNNVVSFVVVLIEVGAMFGMRFFYRIEQDYKLEERASIHPCSKGNNIVPFVVVLIKLELLSAWDFIERIEQDYELEEFHSLLIFSNFQHEILLRELNKIMSLKSFNLSSFCPRSNGSNILPFIFVFVVVLIEGIAIFNMRFSGEDWSWSLTYDHWQLEITSLLQSRTSRASIRRHSNTNNVPSFVPVIESCYSDFQHKIGRGSYCSSSSSRSGCRSSGAQRIDWLTLWRKICTQLLWGFFVYHNQTWWTSC